MKTEVLVIGSGIAGLSFAIKMAEARPQTEILILTKANPYTSNTSHAQGGMAVVLDHVRDNFEQHIEDTMKAGKGLCDPEVVRMVVSQAPTRLQELISWGSKFDVEENGELQLGLEGGHSQNRIVHHQDLTGFELTRKLYQKANSLSNIFFKEHFFVMDLLTKEDSTCIGVRVLDKIAGKQVNINSKLTFLASGGSGMLFHKTTNPSVATADGIALAHRVGAKLTNMQYMQFHPTALFERDKHSLFLISEALRGFGAHMVNGQGNRFLFRYDLRGELATRDIISKAIVTELKTSGEEWVYLDCRHLDPVAFQRHFPSIAGYSASVGLNFQKDLLPVVPAAHYQCGGIEVDQFSRTSIKNLYASGECAHTGLHGANRLASNSLLEAVVYSHQAATSALEEFEHLPEIASAEETATASGSSVVNPDLLNDLQQQLRAQMTYECLHDSNTSQKREALRTIGTLERKLQQGAQEITPDPAYFELKNMLEVACLILGHAIEETDSKKEISKKHQPVAL